MKYLGWRARRWRLAVTLLAVVAALPFGCDAAPGTPSSPPPQSPASREIRTLDLSNLEWFDAMSVSTMRLVDGVARRTADSSAPGGTTWRLQKPVAYADVDGDGDEDAAAGLHSLGGQMSSFSWYIWLWEGGEAVQLRLPIAAVTRCEGPIESVTAVRQGFKIRMMMTDRDDPCVRGGAIPVTYIVGVRDGWPVRIAPKFGPIDTCDPRQLNTAIEPAAAVQLRTASDDRAPTVEPAADYDQVLVHQLAFSPHLPPEEKEWLLVIAVDGERRICGFARSREVLP